MKNPHPNGKHTRFRKIQFLICNFKTRVKDLFFLKTHSDEYIITIFYTEMCFPSMSTSLPQVNDKLPINE